MPIPNSSQEAIDLPMDEAVERHRTVTARRPSRRRPRLPPPWCGRDAPWNAHPQETYQVIQRELAAITRPGGIITRLLRTRQPDQSLQTRLTELTHEHSDCEDYAELVRERRDDVIREAIADGMSVMAIRDLIGLSRERIDQIRDGRN